MEKEENWSCVCLRIATAIFLVAMILVIVLLTCLLELPLLIYGSGGPSGSNSMKINCPDQILATVDFPMNLAGGDIVLDNGTRYLLKSSVTANTITIQNRATLVIADNNQDILIRTKYILIQNQGSLLIGSETCPYMSNLQIALYGQNTDAEQFANLGRKFIIVTGTASIDIHGPWKLSWTFLSTTIQPGSSNMLITLADDASSWKTGDEIVIASSDYNMEHAERFVLGACPTCAANQVIITGVANFTHFGAMTADGVDVRAEVGLLTRNIKIYGEVSSNCNNSPMCKYFNFDIFGGQIKILPNAKVARFEGIELYHMGQQEITSMYPIHFHRVFDATGYYARQLSIHNCFSKCVTIHATQNLLVEDVVGYDTYGHCFFFSDGNEQNNTLRHNLGLVTRAGTILPSERNAVTCVALTTNISIYTPDPNKDCRGVSTYWISHPNNIFENNAAGGSEEVGFYFAFYRTPTGESVGTLPAFDGERSPLKSFWNNRAHSNQKAGFFMDRGVKVSNPSPNDPRDALCLTDLERYAPHVNKSLSAPRAPALIRNFTGYKNGLGMWVRGGDIWISNAGLTDNDVSLTMASSSYGPYDAGSQQQVTDSIIVGQSQPGDADWYSRTSPACGVQIFGGPVLIDGCSFAKFSGSSTAYSYGYSTTTTSSGQTGRTAFPIGFYPNNTGQTSPMNTINRCSFDNMMNVLSFGGSQSDGDINQILYDADGSVTGVRQSYIVRQNNPLMMASSCSVNAQFISYCTDVRYGQLFVNASSKNITLQFQTSNTWTVQNVTYAPQNLTLTGANQFDPQYPTTLQFQPIVQTNTEYYMFWMGGTAPAAVDLSIYNLNQNQYIQMNFCYPPTTTAFVVSSRTVDQITNTNTSYSLVNMAPSANIDSATSTAYAWNSTTGWLSIKYYVTWQTTGVNYCPPDGCHYLTVTANIAAGQGQYSACIVS